MSATLIPFPTKQYYSVRPIAKRIFRKLCPPIQRSDLEQEGYLAVVEGRHIQWAILDYVRHQLSRHEYSLAAPDYAAPETEVRRSLDLRLALEKLPPRQREWMELRLEGRTVKEAGAVLNLTRERARGLERRAIEALRARLCPRELRKAA